MKRLTSGVMAVDISPNKGHAFVLPENYTEGVKIFTFTAYRNNHPLKLGSPWVISGAEMRTELIPHSGQIKASSSPSA
jgi:hypothetical protein